MNTLSVDEPQEQALLRQATASSKQGDFEQALSALKDLLSQNPDHEIATGMLAAVYAELKMPGRAMACFRRVLEINPENPLARLQLGMLQFAAGHPQEALNTWQQCLDEPNDFMAHFQSGLALLQLHRPEDARPLLEIAAQRMPQKHSLYLQLENLLHTI